MALMKFRKQNEIPWVGVRPAHHGTQLVVSVNTNVIAVNTLFTTGAGLCTFITYLWGTHKDNLDQELYYELWDATPALVGALNWDRTAVGYKGCQYHQNFWPPIEFPAGFSLRVNVVVANWCSFGCAGWIE